MAASPPPLWCEGFFHYSALSRGAGPTDSAGPVPRAAGPPARLDLITTLQDPPHSTPTEAGTRRPARPRDRHPVAQTLTTAFVATLLAACGESVPPDDPSTATKGTATPVARAGESGTLDAASNDGAATALLVLDPDAAAAAAAGAAAAAVVEAPAPAADTAAAVEPGTVNSLDTIVNDMKLMNDLALAGVNGSYGWATGPGHVIMGNDPRGTHTPSWFNVSNTYYKSAAYWNAIIPWVVVFDGVGNAASNTRVQMRNMKLYMKRKSTGSWALVSSTQGVDGSLYPKSLSGSDVSNPNSRTETDGSTSVLPPGGNLVYHGWGNLTNLSGSDVAAIFVTLQARLVLNNTSGNDDRSAAKYLIHVGGDYYPETSTRVSDMAPAYYFPGIGVSRAKLVSSQWQAFNFSTIDVGVEDPGGGTISEAELRSNPPPLE